MAHLNNLELADPRFDSTEPIDLLFGVDIYGIIIKDGLRKGQLYEPVAQNSEFGWLVFGAISTKNNISIHVNTTTLSIANELRKFWENEEVKLPPILSERFFQIEKKFKRDKKYFDRYKEDIQGYLNAGHMSLCKDTNDGYFMPHHAIVRENRSTTKQRTVFDASAKSSNGFSLNDRCLNGPTIQPERFDTFIRWRMYKIALVADLEKMYRQILMRPEDRKFQKIIWRFLESEPIKTYQLNTITFRVKPAPYEAIQLHSN